jgi:hypothetical protein
MDWASLLKREFCNHFSQTECYGCSTEITRIEVLEKIILFDTIKQSCVFEAMMEKPTRIFFNENAGCDFVAIRNEAVAGFVKRFRKVYSFVEQK